MEQTLNYSKWYFEIKSEACPDLLVDATTTMWGSIFDDFLFPSIRVRSWPSARGQCGIHSLSCESALRSHLHTQRKEICKTCLSLRRGHMASSSSMNITAGLPCEAWAYASEKASRRNFSPSPTWALCTEYGLSRWPEAIYFKLCQKIQCTIVHVSTKQKQFKVNSVLDHYQVRIAFSNNSSN